MGKYGVAWSASMQYDQRVKQACDCPDIDPQPSPTAAMTTASVSAKRTPTAAVRPALLRRPNRESITETSSEAMTIYENDRQ
jgi:hypothetical protein